jgi:hypothetical protein
MSAEPDLFDEALQASGLGRRYILSGERSKFPDNIFAVVEPLVTDMRDRLVSGGMYVPEILGGVSDDSSFNAFAFAHDGRYVISVNYGALILLTDLVHRLFCLPEAFSWVGDPRAEDASRAFHPLSNDAQSYMRRFIADPRPVIPKNLPRRRAAVFLLPLAIEFIIAHELRHIVGGHLDWLKKHSGGFCISEAERLVEPATGMAYQPLEQDADEVAMYHTLARTLALAERPQDEVPIHWRGVIVTPEHALEVALLCGIIMVGTFLGQWGMPEKWPYYTHPPPGVRHGMNIVAANKALPKLGREDLRLTTTANLAWLARFSNFALVRIWNRIGNPDRRDEMLMSFGPPGQHHLAEVMKAWNNIQPEVAKFAIVFRGSA